MSLTRQWSRLIIEQRLNRAFNSFTFFSWFSFLVCINYEALLRLGSSRCCQRFCYKVRSSDRAYYDDIEYGHQPLKIYADKHINNVPNFFNYILVKRILTVINIYQWWGEAFKNNENGGWTLAGKNNRTNTMNKKQCSHSPKKQQRCRWPGSNKK